MATRVESMNIKQLLADADELLNRIQADTLTEMKEEHRLQFEMHAQNLKRIKSEVQDRIEKKEISKTDHGAEGVHEAVIDIVKAIQALSRFLTWPLLNPVAGQKSTGQDALDEAVERKK